MGGGSPGRARRDIVISNYRCVLRGTFRRVDGKKNRAKKMLCDSREKIDCRTIETWIQKLLRLQYLIFSLFV